MGINDRETVFYAGNWVMSQFYAGVFSVKDADHFFRIIKRRYMYGRSGEKETSGQHRCVEVSG